MNDMTYTQGEGKFQGRIDRNIDGSATTTLYTYELQLLMVTRKDRLVLHFWNILDS